VVQPLVIDNVAPGEHVPSADGRVVISGLSWAQFEAMVTLRGDRSAPRLAYLEGTLELMSPSRHHERIKGLLGHLVGVFAEERQLQVWSYGAWTLRHDARTTAVEPDDCFIIGDQTRARPDLAIEIEWTRGGIDKLEIYRRLGVPEVWWWRDGLVAIYVLEADGYAARAASAVLPGFPMALATELVDAPSLADAMRTFRRALHAG
jgi:Uma2 family endonuclease